MRGGKVRNIAVKKIKEDNSPLIAALVTMSIITFFLAIIMAYSYF